MKETFNICGSWDNNELVWQFTENGKIVHTISDVELKKWIFRQDDLPSHDKAHDGCIRKLHIDLYANRVVYANNPLDIDEAA